MPLERNQVGATVENRARLFGVGREKELICVCVLYPGPVVITPSNDGWFSNDYRVRNKVHADSSPNSGVAIEKTMGHVSNIPVVKVTVYPRIQDADSTNTPSEDDLRVVFSTKVSQCSMRQGHSHKLTIDSND